MIVTALIIAGLVVAIVDEVIARGRSLPSWAIILIAIGLLIARF